MTSEKRVLETDVVILGAGLAGSVTALCLVRQGLRVVILEKETHPRFALGESTTTPSSLWLKVIAERFNAPELLHITTGEGLRRHVAATSGVKTNFGFLYHRKGAATMDRSWQAVIPQAEISQSDLGLPPSSEMHYFRQDVDAYLWFTALDAGAVGRPGTEVSRLDFDEKGATIATSGGETIRCAFVIDASGHRSVVASKFALRDEPPRMRTHSRAIFTHMVGVVPYEDVDRGPKPLAPWSQGTLHHFFDGGWVWVIPFGNHPGSQNKLCSVGVSYDSRRFPKDPKVGPEEEWARFLADFPSIRLQFEDAVSVRPWVSTGRLQYTSRKCVGDRYWLTAHAAGAVDALYSFGNINIFQSIATGVRLVLEAFRNDTFNEQHFQPLQRLTDNLHRFQDRIVYGSYVGMRSPDLLELWFTIWGLTDGARVREVLKPIVRYARTNRLADLCTYDARPEDVLTGFGQSTGIDRAEQVLDRIDEFCDVMQELEDGKATVTETKVRLRAAMESDDRFDMHVDAITQGLGRNPWIFEPLIRHGVKAYSSAFLTPDEVLTLGVQSNGTDEKDKPAAQPWKQERMVFEAQAQELQRELTAHRAQAEALLQELAAHRAQATSLFQEREALLRDRDAWRERATDAEEKVARGRSDRAK